MMMDGRFGWLNDAIALIFFFNFSYYILNLKCRLERNWRTDCVLLFSVYSTFRMDECRTCAWVIWMSRSINNFTDLSQIHAVAVVTMIHPAISSEI